MCAGCELLDILDAVYVCQVSACWPYLRFVSQVCVSGSCYMLSLMVLYVRYLLLAIPVACVSGSYYMMSLMCDYVRHLLLDFPEVAM